MSKKLSLALIGLLMVAARLTAQTFKNEWIDYSRKYYKIRVYKDGLYRIDSAALAKAGIANIDPRNIQLFQKGKPIRPYISGEGDGVFNANDYILFYAEKNKSSDDSALYVQTAFLTNPEYSVINDTSSVFLTWGSSPSGRRLHPDTDTNFAAYNPSPYYIKKAYSAPQDGTAYFYGPMNIVNQTDPRYFVGEGFITVYELQPGSAYTFQPISAVYAAGPKAQITVCVSGRNNVNLDTNIKHEVKVEYQDASNNWVQLDDFSFSAYKSVRKTYFVLASQLASSVNIRISSVANGNNAGNLVNVNYVQVYFPQQFDFQNNDVDKLWLPDDVSQSKSKLVMTGFNNNSNPLPPYLVNVTDSAIYSVKVNGGQYTALVPNSGKTKFCVLASPAEVVNVQTLYAVNNSGSFVQHLSGFNNDSAFLIISNPLIWNEAQQYAAYRSQKFNTKLAGIEDLYDQFAYGVRLHPFSIRNFCAYVIHDAQQSGKKRPSNLLLLGKGIDPSWCNSADYNFYGPADSINFSHCLVPAFGSPPSDILFTEGLPGSSVKLEPAIPTGRVAARSGQDVINYLSKLAIHEQQPVPSAWKKNAIHFIGGQDAGEQATFKGYMTNCQYVFEDTAIGGHVSSFYKTSTAPISNITDDSVKYLINNGVSLMTFFGHGSPTGFDQNIDAPSAYSFNGRFPFILANSCYTGNFFSSDATLTNSEEWVLAPNNTGAIGYLATVSEGVANDLYYYSMELYRQFDYKHYGKPVATQIKETIKKLVIDDSLFSNPNTVVYDELYLQTLMEMTLHGDPSVVLWDAPKPDYTLSNSDLAISAPASQPDSLYISITMHNLGRAVNGYYTVKFERKEAGGDSLVKYLTVKAPYYQSTLHFSIPKDYVHAVGINNFYVKLDAFDVQHESNELNNSIGPIAFFIRGADLQPVWPYEYAVMPKLDKITLKASTSDPFAPLTNYRFEVDTSGTFTGPLFTQVVSAPGGIISYSLNLLNQDSVVYFWRVAKDTSAPNWKTSSFQVINGKRGWEQAHFNQFAKDQYQYVKRDSANRHFVFVNDVKEIKVHDGIYGDPSAIPQYPRFEQVQLFINGGQVRVGSCGPGGLTIGVFNDTSGTLIPSYSVTPIDQQDAFGNAGNCICDINGGNGNIATYDFGKVANCYSGTDPNWQNEIINFLNGPVIPNGAAVVLYTVRGDFPDFHDPLGQALNDTIKNMFGALKVDSVSDTTTYILFGRKRMPSFPAQEAISHYKKELVTLTATLTTRFNNGFISSGLIGPAQPTDTAWKSLHFRFGSLDSIPTKDSLRIRLIGIDTAGQEQVLENFLPAQEDVFNLYSYGIHGISGKQYPYLKLVAYEADNQYRTPPQLRRWQVIFDPVPEAALDPPAGFSVIGSNNVAEGQDLKLRIPIRNISDLPFTDSLLVTYFVEDANRVQHNLPYHLKKKPFMPDEVIYDTLTVPTLGYAGSDNVWIDVNPPGHPRYQLEQYHFNNIAEFGYNVNKDKINPVLDVTFDGIHILNNDIVSSKPDILISLKDENKFLALNDTGSFAVYLTSPGSSAQQRLFFNDPLLRFTPAVLPNNSAKIEYKPALANDGTYSLRVRASDRSSNASGQFDYTINFDVVNKPMITEVLNYPNPFSTSTRFVFTITGSQVPETFKIQIMTISGKVVKEITREELGWLHIGRNITDYAWDGKDEYGGKLANGVYFYHVITKLNGGNIEHMSTDADQYFKHNIGKMVIMR